MIDIPNYEQEARETVVQDMLRIDWLDAVKKGQGVFRYIPPVTKLQLEEFVPKEMHATLEYTPYTTVVKGKIFDDNDQPTNRDFCAIIYIDGHCVYLLEGLGKFFGMWKEGDQYISSRCEKGMIVRVNLLGQRMRP